MWRTAYIDATYCMEIQLGILESAFSGSPLYRKKQAA